MKFVRKGFKREMVVAILNGTKTQTRRTKPFGANVGDVIAVEEAWWSYGRFVDTDRLTKTGKVKRAWEQHEFMAIHYAADYPEAWRPSDPGYAGYRWRKMSSMFLPLKDSRLFLKIDRLWEENLNDISPADAVAEGIQRLLSSRAQIIENGGELYLNYWSDKELFMDGVKPVESYETLWESINGFGSWALNPRIFAAAFTKLAERPTIQ